MTAKLPEHLLTAWFLSLDHRERTIVQLRYLHKPPWSLEALGHELDVTRERVRQIEARMLDRADALLALRRAGNEGGGR